MSRIACGSDQKVSFFYPYNIQVYYTGTGAPVYRNHYVSILQTDVCSKPVPVHTEQHDLCRYTINPPEVRKSPEGEINSRLATKLDARRATYRTDEVPDVPTVLEGK